MTAQHRESVLAWINSTARHNQGNRWQEHDTPAEFSAHGCGPDQAAEKFARAWGGTLEWLTEFRRFRMGNTVYRIEFIRGGYSIYEVKK